MRFSTLAIVSTIFIPALSVAAKTVDVVMADLPVGFPGVGVPKFLPRFEPPTVDINVGDTVRWTNKGTVPHTVDEGADCTAVANGQLFSSGPVPRGGTFEYTFNTAGEFPYFCLPHCAVGSMKGTVSVKANPTSANDA
ncbi:Cupredoxin [Linnemannia elongata AG-77]|uniref:Cupredoxin n=1 Tax=Linnemannia elongata AG-77 TaxID=1314771 RepID=A0A197JYA4_9FUNG|nr:Cupredoxin [Linnemannia elongata AG-77]